MTLLPRKILRIPIHFIWMILSLLSCSLAHATFVQVSQISSPVGYVSLSEAVAPGTAYQTIQPNLTSSGYTFGYWSVGGNRLTDSDGRSITRGKITVNAATTITAHYFLSTVDTDTDGLLDWFEFRNFGNLDQNASSDSDTDGFTNGQENGLGQEPTVKDSVQDGGISSRISSGFVFADSSMVHYLMKSDPIGFITSTEGYVEINASVTSSNLHAATNGYHFAYWSVNGTRQAGPTGTALNQVTTKLQNDSTIVAHYVLSTLDGDTDSVMDWFEFNQFGNLANSPDDDPDGDGFKNSQESELGQEANIKDSVQDGGISSRISSDFVFADTSLVKYTIKSDPIGFITTSEGYVEINASVPTQSLNGAINGYHFAYWTVNGVRQHGPTGVALSQINPKIENDSSLIAHYFLSTLDSDNDSVMDWFEQYQFGNLSNGPTGDPDADGFTNSQESALGQEANIKDSVQDGGISSRISGDVLFFLQVNNPPSNLQLSNSTVHSGKPLGELVGTLIPTDPDHDPGDTYQISILDGNGSTDRNKFSLSGLNLLTTASLPVGTYLINLRVSDDENESLDKNFTISSIYDPNKDDDNDGLTYAQEQALGTSDNNNDSDGDGFSDLVESNYGSNPADANSTANAAPTDLNNSAPLSFFENEPIGTLITDFNATDPDANATLTFSISGPNAPLFSIDSNGTLYTNTIFDFENNASSYGLLIRVTDQHSAFLEVSKNFVLKNSNESPESITPSNTSFFENQPISTLIGDFNATDPDANSTFTYSISGSNAQLFNIDPNGSLYTNAIFDFENNASLYTLLIRVTDEHNASLEISQDILLKNSNEPPSTLALTNSTFFENQLIGSLVGSINATDPDANTTLSYSILESNGTLDHHLFFIDSNGSLKTAQSFDFETNNTNYSINIRASDEQNASINQTFTLTLQNIIEDLDNDGTEDYYDLDDDGDGFSDADEIANNSDPRDALSTLNQPPSSIDLNGSSIAENMPTGSIVGQFSAIDPDANSSLSFYLVHTNAQQPIVSTNSNSSSAKFSDSTTADSNQTTVLQSEVESNMSAPFIVDPNGTLRTTQPIDFENSPNLFTIKVRVSDEWNASIEKEFTIQILDLDENAPVISLLGESIITLLSTDTWIDPGATWTDLEDGNGTIFAQNDLNQTHPTLEEWVQNGKKLPEGMMFMGGTPWFDESTGQNREDKEVYDMLFAIKTGEYQLTYQYRDQAGNLSNLAIRTLLIIHPTKPIVQTLNAIIDENGSVQFGAEIRSGAKMELIETGIHYGTDQIFSEFNQIPLSLSTITDQYFSTPLKPQGNNQIFYRAYARNKAGTSYGSVKNLTLPSESNATAWWSGSIEIAGGWRNSPWFGTFLPYPQGWIYHIDLGWLFTHPGETGDLWLWSNELGWLWSGPGVYPYLFHNSTENWLYFLAKREGKPLFYDYNTKSIK